MSPRAYKYLCIAFCLTAGLFWVTGLMTPLVFVVFGFVSFGLVFMGMMCVLPASVSHPQPAKTKPAPAARKVKVDAPERVETVGVLKAA